MKAGSVKAVAAIVGGLVSISDVLLLLVLGTWNRRLAESAAPQLVVLPMSLFWLLVAGVIVGTIVALAAVGSLRRASGRWLATGACLTAETALVLHALWFFSIGHRASAPRLDPLVSAKRLRQVADALVATGSSNSGLPDSLNDLRGIDPLWYYDFAGARVVYRREQDARGFYLASCALQDPRFAWMEAYPSDLAREVRYRLSETSMAGK